MSAELRIPIDITETVTVKHEGPQRPDTPARADDPALSRPTATAQQATASKPSSASQTAAQQPQQAPPPKPAQQGPQRRFNEEQWAALSEKDRDALAKQWRMGPPESAEKPAAPAAQAAAPGEAERMNALADVMDEADRRLERRAKQEAVEREMRSVDDSYRAQQEEIEARRELAAGISDLVDERRRERLMLAQMTEDQKVEYLAQKEAQRRAESQAVQARVEQLEGPKAQAAFDPYAAAEKSYESQVKREQIKLAYQDLYGTAEETKAAFDASLDLAQKMRGTLGGVLGTMAGSALDVVSAVRAMNPKKSAAREEAEHRNAERVQQPQPRSASQKVADVLGLSAPERARKPAAESVREPAPTVTANERSEQKPQSTMDRIGDMLGFGKKEPKVAAESVAKAKPLPTATAAPADAVNKTNAATSAVAKPLPTATAAPAASSGAAAGGAGAMSGMAAAAGPAAAAIAVAVAVQEALDGVKKGAVSLTRGLGETTASLARFDDGTTRLDQTGTALGTFGDRMMTINPVLGISAAVHGQAAQNVAMLSREVKETSSRLAQYSGPLAQQQAMQEVAEMLRDINRAQRFGEVTARANEARFAMEQRFNDIADRFIPFVMAIAEKIFLGIERGITVVDDGLKMILRALDSILETIRQAPIIAQAEAVRAAIDRVRALIAVALQDNENNDADFWDDFVNSANGIVRNAQAMPGMPGAAIGRPLP